MTRKKAKKRLSISNIPLIIKTERKGYSVECIDLNIVTQGSTLKEAKKNAVDAITLHLKSAEELGMLDSELEKLGVVRKNSHIEIPECALDLANIKLPC